MSDPCDVVDPDICAQRAPNPNPVRVSLCTSGAKQNPNAVLTNGQLMELRANAAVFYDSQTNTNPSYLPRFKSAAAYMQYKKARVYAGFTPNPKLPPQSAIFADIKATGATYGCTLPANT
jgi:hypothetical protein